MRAHSRVMLHMHCVCDDDGDDISPVGEHTAGTHTDTQTHSRARADTHCSLIGMYSTELHEHTESAGWSSLSSVQLWA